MGAADCLSWPLLCRPCLTYSLEQVITPSVKFWHQKVNTNVLVHEVLHFSPHTSQGESLHMKCHTIFRTPNDSVSLKRAI